MTREEYLITDYLGPVSILNVPLVLCQKSGGFPDQYACRTRNCILYNCILHNFVRRRDGFNSEDSKVPWKA